MLILNWIVWITTEVLKDQEDNFCDGIAVVIYRLIKSIDSAVNYTEKDWKIVLVRQLILDEAYNVLNEEVAVV